jgi:hypothetical protein
MKTYVLALAFSVISLSVFAATNPTTTGPTTTSKARTPKYYIMMKHGKLFEYKLGKTIPVKKDVTLTNETTIHPNGAIDASSGQALQLKNGQYITMDGKIRNLRDMPRSTTATH